MDNNNNNNLLEVKNLKQYFDISTGLFKSKPLKAVDDMGYILIVTADHGNADEMLEANKKGELQPRTAHSLNKVPFIIYGDCDIKIKEGEFGLSNIASTVTEIMDLGKNSVWDESIII